VNKTTLARFPINISMKLVFGASWQQMVNTSPPTQKLSSKNIFYVTLT